MEPGSTFSYILEIVNNGPSDATGVVVTDDLPDVGVSYQSASRVPDSFDGDQLTFQLGDLAKGESTSITINVLPGSTGSRLSVLVIATTTAYSIRASRPCRSRDVDSR